ISLMVILTSIVFSQSVEIKDGDSHILSQFNDEGTAGSLTLPDAGEVGPNTNKLYNNSGNLFWSGSALGNGHWTLNSTDIYYNSGYVGIGVTTPQGVLDLTSTTGALIVPRMTSEEREGLPTINGSIIYNTTDNQFNFRENGAWITK
ncbi:hypothetical protein ACFLZA_02575, partial [Candidatus Neomarinimicrobiota bacterium]